MSKKKVELKFVLPSNISKVSKKKDIVEDRPVIKDDKQIVEQPVENEESYKEEESDSEEATQNNYEEEYPDEEKKEDSSPHLDYDPYEVPKGSKENGITLCIVLFSILIVLMLGMIYQQASWRNWEEQASVFVDPEYRGLSQVVKTYYTSMKDPSKEMYATEIRKVLSGVKSSAEPSENEQSITLSIQDILGFNKSKTLDESKYEYEWQGLFGSTGIIDSWLSNNNMEVTKSNQCKVYNAIAEGLK